ncbi:centrosomal protein of 192 kDa [Tiliqua scincoides]|uniref:centrosomal protein of 192 kDa n=1 Tax=Tiliqua scincoides TaxID=71010 RepID=UPI0034631F3F
MFVARSIAADHRDLIHDVSFDFHGRRMATCSSDQSVKVWDKGENGEWHCTASWKTHSGSVWRVTWAHPEFGQVLASCSFDRTAAVWEEIVGESNDKLRGQSHWVKRTTLVDSRTSVTDVKFAPKHMGLMLATCSADGVVRIYEAPDVMNLSQWSLQHEISCKLSCSCISWNPSSCRAHAPMIAVGSDDSSSNLLAKVQIYEYNENTRKYAKAETLMTVTDPVHDIAFAPNLGRSFHILAVATKDVRIFTLKPLRKELTPSSGLTKFEVQLVAQFDNHNSQVWRVSWNITGTVLASSGDDGCVRLWKANYMDNWKCTGILKGNGSPVNASSTQQGVFNAPLGTTNTSLQNSVNGTSAGRYFFPPLDSPRAGSRWSSHTQLLPPPLIEHSGSVSIANLQYPHPRRRYISRPLNLLREHEGVYEIFPSFLATSSTSHTSDILDNITISSNLGLPVAASTEARHKTGCHDRLCDQVSYVEGRLSVPLESSYGGESDSDPRGKLILNSQENNDYCNKAAEIISELEQKSDSLKRKENKNCTDECSGNSQDTLHERHSLENLAGFTARRFVERENKIHKVASLEPCRKWVIDDNDVTGYSRFIENEKLSFASYEEHSTDDDIGDEEFCDDQLKAYFEQLVFPEMEDAEEHELVVSDKAVELSLDQEKFHIPSICQDVATTDFPVASDEGSYELKETGHNVLDKQFMLLITERQEEDECSRSSQGDHSDKPSVGLVDNPSEIPSRTDSLTAQSSVDGQVANENNFPLDDVYLSPSTYRQSEQYLDSAEEQPHNVVYQNEEGRWVTDLAYYTSFKEQAFNHSDISGDFISGSEAIAMIAQDQEEFEREHKFMQEEQIDPQSTSGLGDTSWKSASNYNAVRASQTEDFIKDASYLRLSLGEFFGQRSEALGCLGGGGDVKRPSFGYHITSPERRLPIPLLMQSDVSEPTSDQRSDTLQGDLEERIKEQLHTASSALMLGEIDTQIRKQSIDKSMDNNYKIQEELAERKVESKLSELKTSVLSISTIASAVTNASVSAEPLQLADMIMMLSNKCRERTYIPQVGKPTNVSVVNQLLSSKVENSVFDIEKYLKRTDEAGNDSEPESFAKYEETTSDWQNFLYKGYGVTHARDFSQSNLYNKYPEETQHLERTQEENSSKDSHCDASGSEERGETEYLEAASNISGNFQSKKLSSSIQDLRENTSGSVKVSLEDNAMKFDSSGEAVVVTEQKLTTPVAGMQISGDEQYDFRPSTSPLTHSSPSEASGTAASGIDVDCSCTTLNSKQLSYNDGVLPKSVYSSPNLERLTFVSATENTLKNLAPSSPEKHQNNGASKLSTTIIWASPTSPLGQDHVKKDIVQRNIHVSPSTSQNTLAVKLEGNESVESNRQLEDQKSTGEHSPKRVQQSADKWPKYNGLAQADMARTQDNYTKAIGLSLNMLPAYGNLGGYIPLNQNIANFKSHSAASEIPAISSGVPTLLTGCSLRTTPLAQQYLGNLPSHSTIGLPQYHVSCPPLFGVPSSLLYSTIPVGSIQSSVTAGMTLSSDIRSGALGTTPHCNFTSNQKMFNSTSGSGQTADVGRSREPEESMSLGFVHVKVPEELKFPNACCVGLTSHTVLSIRNPSERWLQVIIGLVSVMLNGEKMDSLKHRCLLFKNKTVIGPCATEDLKILFLPCQAGVFQCVLSVASWPFSSDADTIVQAEALATRVILNAVAENPELEVESGKGERLDFGDLPYGSWKALPLKLTNKTHARVPVRLVIHANAIAWRCFTFSKEPVNTSVESTLYTCNISQLAAPSVISHVMNASCDGQDSEVLVVWVQFRAPRKRITSDSLGPPDEYLARIDVEVDCPEPANVLKSIPLSARSGTPRIYAPKGLQTLYMSARIGLSTKQQLPLKNAGNIKVDLKLVVLEPDSNISVIPEELSLTPGEEQEMTVVFSPKDCRNAESVVKIFVLPSGPEYKVTVKGEVSVLESKPLPQKWNNSEVPPILANKQFVLWGGVQLGRTVQQKLILRNDSRSATQQLRLLIRGQDQDCFQLKLGDHTYNNCEIKIQPKHDYSVYVIFTPSRLACMFAKLEMKQLGFLSRLGMKFTIPLYGYGGKSNVILEDVNKHCNSYIVGLTEPSPGKTSQTSFSIRNTGCRAAYVKVLCFKNFCKRIIMDADMMNIFPEKFVLKESAQQKITVTCSCTKGEQNISVFSTICIFYGDEISRQQYCRAIQHNRDQEQKILPPDNPVINVKFDEEFPGEELVTEVYDLPQQTNDVQCFFASMRRITLSVVNASTSSFFTSKQSSVHHMASRPGVFEKNIMTLDVLPVRGPQGCVLSSNTNDVDENKFVTQETWSVQPECLTLAAPSLSGTTDTRHVQITNNSNRLLKFELSWPAHCLTVTPQQGTIAPGSCISIHVSPNPSLAENKSLFPWSGLIYIHCDNGQKLVRVQIRESTSDKSSQRSPAVAKVGGHNQHTEFPVVHVIKSLEKLSSTKVEIKNRMLCFPETKSGENSEKYLEIENNGDENVRWFLSSFAPPYVKDVDDSGEVYRATYTAFRCSCISGTLEAHGKERVVVSFLPRDRGHYSQFWDLECHPLHKPSQKEKHRLQFSGVGITENESSTASSVKAGVQVASQRRDFSDTTDHETGKGVFAQEDTYVFPTTRVGESSMLKISMRNYSTSTNKLTFLSPREPFYIKHSHYNLRCHHYCNLPVLFKPMSSGTFQSLLVVQTDKSGTVTIQLIGQGLE